ncbi:virulence promoting factor, partial [Escherichia coli]
MKKKPVAQSERQHT